MEVMIREGVWTLSAVLQAFLLQDGQLGIMHLTRMYIRVKCIIHGQLKEAIWMKGPVAGPCAGRSFEMCIGLWRNGGLVCSCRS